MKKFIICAAVALMLFGDEVAAWLALVVLAALGLGWLLKAAAEGGFFE